MKKNRGFAFVAIGVIMITLQIISMIGVLSSGESLPPLFTPAYYASFTVRLYDFIFGISYYSIGIIGLILFFKGLDYITR